MKIKNLLVMLVFTVTILFAKIGSGQDRVHNFLPTTSPLCNLLPSDPSQEKMSEAEQKIALEGTWDYTIKNLIRVANILGPKALVGGKNVLSGLYDIITFPVQGLIYHNQSTLSNNSFSSLEKIGLTTIMVMFTTANLILLPTAMYLAATNPAKLIELKDRILDAGPLGYGYIIQLLLSAANTLGPKPYYAYLSLVETYNDIVAKTNEGTLTQAEAKAAEAKMLKNVKELEKAVA